MRCYITSSLHECTAQQISETPLGSLLQLPAVVCVGITVVVCPLLSLMQDQVMALCCLPAAGVPTTYLSSQQSAGEARAVRRELAKEVPSCKLLYVTPEQLVKSAGLQAALTGLMQRGRLSRFVIDEVCIRHT